MDIENLIADLQEISQKNSISHYKRGKCAGAATALSTLQAENETLRAELEQIKAERDAAVEDLRQMCVGANTCAFCKKSRADCKRMGPGRKTVEPCWEWRGIKEG